MTQDSGLHRPFKWDLARLPDEGVAGKATWSETFAPRIMGSAMTLHSEFFEQVSEIRAGADPFELASRYVRRDQGQRVEALRVYFEAAAEAEPHVDGRYVKQAVWNLGTRAWTVEADLQPNQPQRALRVDIIDTMSLAALRVARRGAGRCAQPDCASGAGAKLAADHQSDHCEAHAWLDRRPREFVEIDRALFGLLVPILLLEREKRKCRVRADWPKRWPIDVSETTKPAV